MTTHSYLTHLECTNCGKILSADEPQTICPDCGKVLYARYDLEAAKRGFDRAALASRPGGMWRWAEIMPVRDEANIVSLGEGGTPLLRGRGIESATGAKCVW